ncbi:MAG: hypothetical protein EA357_05225 [Micavibrio sp.]|jgi:septum formation inhibitor MinC|nr:MAG: hypothetical protein EA357_05225 [Micavibrio sp.]
MPVTKRPFFMKIAVCSAAVLLLSGFPAGDASAGFKWRPPATPSVETAFPGEKKYGEPVIHWHDEELPRRAEKKDSYMVSEDLPAPVTSETLGGLRGDTTSSYVETDVYDPYKSEEYREGDLISQIVGGASAEEKPAYKKPAATAHHADAPILYIEGAQIAEGFGTDIPLVMAVRQIIPSSQPFAFEPDVNLSTPVSWQGGAVWPEVLSRTLSSVGLYARKHRDMVIIGHDDGMQPAPVKEEARADMFTTAQRQKPAADKEIFKPAVAKTQAAPVSAAPQQTAHVETWNIRSGQTLRDAVAEWSDRAGVQLYWTTDYDYRIDSDRSFYGSFDQALGELLDSFNHIKPQPYGQLHKTSEGMDVLVIKAYESVG